MDELTDRDINYHSSNEESRLDPYMADPEGAMVCGEATGRSRYLTSGTGARYGKRGSS